MNRNQLKKIILKEVRKVILKEEILDDSLKLVRKVLQQPPLQDAMGEDPVLQDAANVVLSGEGDLEEALETLIFLDERADYVAMVVPEPLLVRLRKAAQHAKESLTQSGFGGSDPFADVSPDQQPAKKRHGRPYFS